MAGQLLNRLALDALYFSGAAGFLRPLWAGMGAILMLHRVRPGEATAGFAPNAHLSVEPRFLDRLLAMLAKRGREFVTMDEVARRLTGESASRRRFVAITLDDGYRDNLEHAVPLFRKYAAPYTIYVCPGFVEGRADLWWEDLEMMIRRRDSFVLPSPRGNIRFDVPTAADKRRVFAELLQFLTTTVGEDEQRRIVRDICWQRGFDPDAWRRQEIMGWGEIAGLAGDSLCTIGAHTIHHFALARLDAERAKFELEESARIVELETGKWPRHFAFPYGYPAAAGPRDFELAKAAGFVTAVTTRHGVVCADHANHMQALPRISVNGRFQAKRHMVTMLSGVTTRLANRGRALDVG
jgi:peptidoglycan/xylan/chitin deacetylase (PgdA/CDA1 family)